MSLALEHPERDDIELSRVLAALADPLRRAVIVRLFDEPEGFAQNCTAFGLPVTKATRTHHFRILREAGLIRMHSDGNWLMSSLRRDDIEARFPGLLASVAADGRPDTDAARDGRSRARSQQPNRSPD